MENNNDLQTIADLLNAAEVEAMRSYVKARVNGKDPDEAQALAEGSWDLGGEEPTPATLGQNGHEVDHVVGYEVHDGNVTRGVAFHLEDGRELIASQKTTTGGPSHGGDPDEGTFEILVVGPDGENAEGSRHTPPGQAVKGGLSAEDVLRTLREMATDPGR